MSSGKKLVLEGGEVDANQHNRQLARIWALQTSINKLVMDGRRDAQQVGDALQEIVGNAEPAVVKTEKFFLLVDLDVLVVPRDYDHATALSTFLEKNRRLFYDVDDNINDANFRNPSRILKPGDKFRVRVFQQIVRGTITSQECLDFLRSQNAVFTGAQGASLVFKQRHRRLPMGRWYASFDEKERLWQNNYIGTHGVPGVGANLDGGFYFNLGLFEGQRFGGDDVALLCFNDLSAEVGESSGV